MDHRQRDPGDAAAHESGLIRAFVARGKRERFLKLLATPRGRTRMIHQLAHFHDLDPRFAHRIPPNEQTTDAIYRLLREKGAPETCYVMGDSELDGREVDLRDALGEIVGRSFGNFLSCVPGRLGYFEGEEPNERYILERQAPALAHDDDAPWFSSGGCAGGAW